MKKRDTFVLIAFLILSPLIISVLIHYFQNRAEESKITTINFPTEPVNDIAHVR